MADDGIIEAEETQEGEEKEVKEEEVKTEEVPDEEEEKKSFIQKTLNKLGVGGGTNIEDKHEETEGEVISEKFIAAALELGWTDGDIEKFAADYSDEDLEEMIPFLSAEEPEQEKDAPAEKEEKPSPNKLKLEDNAIVQELRKEIADLKKEVGADKQSRQDQDIITSVNTAFDKAAEEFEVFGKSEELPKFPAGPRKGQIIPTSPAVKARNQVWAVASTLMAGGMSVGDAMEEAMSGYKGRNLEKDVQRKIIKGLKRKSTKLSAKRMGKETVKTYEDEDDRKAEVVREAARKRGIEL